MFDADLIKSGLTSPVGIELDISGYLYWSETLNGDTISRSDLDGNNVVPLVMGWNNANGLALSVPVPEPSARLLATIECPYAAGRLRSVHHNYFGCFTLNFIEGPCG